MSLLIPSGVRAGGPDPQDMAQHPSPVWDTPQLCCRCVLGFWVQAGGERGAEGGLGLWVPGDDQTWIAAQMWNRMEQLLAATCL